MEPSASAGKDNTAVLPSLNGPHVATDDAGARVGSLNLSISSGSSNGNSSGASRQQLKLVHGSGTASGRQSQRAPANHVNNVRLKKAAAGVELKSKIIDFMRDRPYLWNKLHPSYNDNKKRENEFNSFSQNVGYSIPEIKRVWHVLRTNFFRAHKMLAKRGPIAGRDDKSERCWKYYQSMRFILVDSPGSKTEEGMLGNNNNMYIDDDSSSSIKDVRETRHSKVLKEARGSKRLVQKIANQVSTNRVIDNGNNSTGTPSNLLIIPATTATTATPSISMSSDSNITLSSDLKSNPSRSFRANHDNEHETTGISSDRLSLVQGRPSTFSSFDGGVCQISFDDGEHLYARSLTATLKKFDPTTREVIKLKFQEIIVEYMQKQQQQLRLHQNLAQLTSPQSR